MYQAVFRKYGESVHVPVEADSLEQAVGRAYRDNPMLASWALRVRPLQEGKQPVDDRAELKFVEPEQRMGRPSQGRSVRLQVSVTPQVEAWLHTQRAEEDKSLSDVVFRMLEDSHQRSMERSR